MNPSNPSKAAGPIVPQKRVEPQPTSNPSKAAASIVHSAMELRVGTFTGEFKPLSNLAMKKRPSWSAIQKRLEKLIEKEKKARAADETLVIKRAVEVIGDKQEAMRWMGTPVRALGYGTPISLLHSKPGMRSVLAVLDQLEHGVL
jgi:putative toxin-antitoxin system antitoxin component (TIGR02293 family)